MHIICSNGTSSGWGYLELLPKLSVVLIRYPEEEKWEYTMKHTKVYLHILTKGDVKIKEVEVGAAACSLQRKIKVLRYMLSCIGIKERRSDKVYLWCKIWKSSSSILLDPVSVMHKLRLGYKKQRLV